MLSAFFTSTVGQTGISTSVFLRRIFFQVRHPSCLSLNKKIHFSPPATEKVQSSDFVIRLSRTVTILEDTIGGWHRK